MLDAARSAARLPALRACVVRGPVDASYHCWIQFFAPNYGWLPLDLSLAALRQVARMLKRAAELTYALRSSAFTAA